MPILLLSPSTASPAYADICLQDSIAVSMENVPASLGSDDENLLFDGASLYTGDGDLALRGSNTPGEQALIMKMDKVLLANTTFEIFYEVDDADGQRAQDYADVLNLNGYGAWYWDYDNNGILEGADFDLGGDGDTNLASGDYSPLGIVVQLFRGDPGMPAGSGSGTLVHTAYSPVQLIESIAYSFTVTAPEEFDYLVIQSTPDGADQDPRVIEIIHNGSTNSVQDATYGSSVNCGLLVHNYL